MASSRMQSQKNNEQSNMNRHKAAQLSTFVIDSVKSALERNIFNNSMTIMIMDYPAIGLIGWIQSSVIIYCLW